MCVFACTYDGLWSQNSLGIICLKVGIVYLVFIHVILEAVNGKWFP